MKTFHEYMNEYKKQLEKGNIKKAYQGLMEYIRNLRSYLKNKYPDYSVSGSIYYGYMDMTYFSFIPESLKRQNLKIAIVFIHDTCRFEVWLAGYNRSVQTKYVRLFKESKLSKYPIAPMGSNSDFIIRHILVDDPEFSNLDMLTEQIEIRTLDFIGDIETFLSKYEE
jgi:hypothetical protein